MSEVENATHDSTIASQNGSTAAWIKPNTIQHPGLTQESAEIHHLAAELPKRLAVFTYKQAMSSLWVVFLGGTGTGKSTVFNAFCGKTLSETGVERPTTRGPIVYAHRDCPVEKNFPFPTIGLERHSSESFEYTPAAGNHGHLVILEHDRPEWSHLIVVDTPDLDSIEAENRRIARDLYLLSDAVLFVTSQEKYADEIPYQFLARIIKEKKPYFLVLNKAQDPLSEEEVIETLHSQTVSFNKDRIRFIPYAASHQAQWIANHPAFQDLVQSFMQEVSADGIEEFREKQHTLYAEDLSSRLRRLLDLLTGESQEAQKWLNALEALYEKTTQEMIQGQKQRFAEESREYLKTEIRRLFAKYDLLARPRRFVREILLTPFRLLGLGGQKTSDSHKEALARIRQRIDLTPVQLVIEKFNRLVLERLSPADENAPLFRELRQPRLVLSGEEVRERIWKSQDQLAEWLEQKFKELSQGIPKGKELGIYSTSILWGILIIAFETTLGGGFTVIDAALDTALAPFLTKGAAELFAYHEIQKVARELAQRYQEGLLSVVQEQRDRYKHCLKSLMTGGETIESLQALHGELASRERQLPR